MSRGLTGDMTTRRVHDFSDVSRNQRGSELCDMTSRSAPSVDGPRQNPRNFSRYHVLLVLLGIMIVLQIFAADATPHTLDARVINRASSKSSSSVEDVEIAGDVRRTRLARVSELKRIRRDIYPAAIGGSRTSLPLTTRSEAAVAAGIRRSKNSLALILLQRQLRLLKVLNEVQGEVSAEARQAAQAAGLSKFLSAALESKNSHKVADPVSRSPLSLSPANPPCDSTSPSSDPSLRQDGRRGEYTLRYVVGVRMNVPNNTSSHFNNANNQVDVDSSSGDVFGTSDEHFLDRSDLDGSSSGMPGRGLIRDDELENMEGVVRLEHNVKVKRGPKFCINDCLSQEMSFVRCRYVCN